MNELLEQINTSSKVNPVTEQRIQEAMSQGDRVVLAIRKKLENKKFNIAWKRNGVTLISPFGTPANRITSPGQ